MTAADEARRADAAAAHGLGYGRLVLHSLGVHGGTMTAEALGAVDLIWAPELVNRGMAKATPDGDVTLTTYGWRVFYAAFEYRTDYYGPGLIQGRVQ
jgi:hypothetical protein